MNFLTGDHTPMPRPRIPLERMESGIEKLLRQEADIELIEGIYNLVLRDSRPGKVLCDGKPVPTNDTLPLFKYFDTQYYGLVNLGKPGKTFKMVMDTAWSYSWVYSNDCPRSSLPCAIHNRYDHRGSSTYKPDGRSFNVANKFIGYLSQDTFLVGQMMAKNQTFGELLKVPWIYSLYGTDGTIGLGFKDLSPGVTPFFYNFYVQNKLKSPIFSFYINRDPTTKRGGSLFFGGIDTTHNKSAFTEIQVTSPYYWQFSMDKVTVIVSSKEQYLFCQSGCTSLADTSSNTIVGPPDEIKAINRLIGATTIFFSNRYLIPCVNEYKGPKVAFTINKTKFLIKAQDYIQKLSYSGFTMCLSAFTPADKELPKNTWILGGAFLYQYYTAYDIINKKIYMAEAA